MYILWLKAHPTTLRSVEARSCYGDTLTGYILEQLKQRLVCIYEVWRSELRVPARMLDKSPLNGEVADIVTACVVVQQAVEAYRGAGKDTLANLDILLQSTRGAEAEQGELLELVLHLSGCKVDICKCIELGNDDVDIVCADTCRKSGHTTTLV